MAQRYKTNAAKPLGTFMMESSRLAEAIILRLGGENVLAQIGALEFFSDGTRVSFKLNHWNPKGVRSVIISTQPRGFFSMQCYSEIVPGTLTAPLIGTAQQIIPENLATVFCDLTGIESIRHRHF